jgi:hypothetical protein
MSSLPNRTNADVTDHRPVAVAQRRVREIAAEDGAEGVAVENSEDAERADRYVDIDRVGMAAENPSASPRARILVMIHLWEILCPRGSTVSSYCSMSRSAEIGI